MWPFIVEFEATTHLLPGVHRTLAQQIYVYAPKTYPDKWGVSLGKWRANSGIDKVPSLRAKSLLAAVQPNLISALGWRISKGVISVRKNKCFLCITVSREHSDQEERGRMSKYRNRKMLFFSILLCLCVLSFFHHILWSDSSHFNTNKGSNYGKHSSLPVPTMPPSSP